LIDKIKKRIKKSNLDFSREKITIKERGEEGINDESTLSC